MFVTRIIGKCPNCKIEASFGNVSLNGNVLTCGCMQCNFSQQFLLPALSKTVIYLDQFFFSHAFRAELREFVECTKLISSLAHDQLTVCPYSSIHETETHQWNHSQQQKLWEFIKRTSRGHSFSPSYDIKRRQIIQAFIQFSKKKQSSFQVNRDDALPNEINEWEDYFFVDVQQTPHNIDQTRKLKQKSIEELVNLFPAWQNGNKTFEEHQQYELQCAGNSYIEQYCQMALRIANGDLDAILDSPIDSNIVEAILQHIDNGKNLPSKLQIILSFFQSQHFARVPYEFIATGLVTVLRDRVKRGQFQNPEKAKKRLSGFFFDLDFIAAYTPYCDAMFIDNAMSEFAKDKRLDLEGKFGTKFYSRNNWNDFVAYLNSLQARKTKELFHALDLVYPPQ